jgi:AraC-like DNA-binding protein/mannose-6-phosphate isomerase-like protein (cupin superfamily)
MNPSEGKISTASIRKVIRDMKPPAGLFSGLTWSRAMAPDNIVFFKRTDSAALRSVLGVSSNYHHRFELVVVLENGGPSRIDDKSFLLQPGECVLIFPHQFHHFIDNENGAIEWLFITFELGESSRIGALKNAPRALDTEGMRLVHDIVREYVRPESGKPDAVEISYRLSRLLLHLVHAPLIAEERRDIHTSDDVRDVILEKINRHVRSHLSAALTIGELADALGYSVSHLRAVFRTRLGISLGRYIRESRLSEAAKLLQSSDLKISEVAERSGFESLFAFSRAFKKAYGMPPKTYGKLVREGAIPERESKPEW